MKGIVTLPSMSTNLYASALQEGGIGKDEGRRKTQEEE